METPSELRIFLSCVSDEFHKCDPKDPACFTSYRDFVALNLRKAGIWAIVQEEFAEGFGDLLETIDDEVGKCHVIVHLVGDMAGISPKDDELRRLRGRHPELLAGEPTLAAHLEDHPDASYTQWEYYLSWQHRKRRLVFFATPQTLRSPLHRRVPEQLASQDRHQQLIRTLGEHRDAFLSPSDLCNRIFAALIRHRLTPLADEPVSQRRTGAAATPVAAALLPSPRQVAELMAQGLKSIKADTTIEAFVAALRSLGQRLQLSLHRLIRLLDQHEDEQRLIVKSQRNAGTLHDLAFAQLAVGSFEQAMQTAAESGHLARQRMESEPERFVEHRSAYLNACLLRADAAQAAHQPDLAIAALREGGQLISQEKEPLLWADYHEGLAEKLLAFIRYQEAEPLIRTIIVLREEHQGLEHPQLAQSLYLLADLLHCQGRWPGVEAVAGRILRIEEGLPVTERPLLLPALNMLGLALEQQGLLDEAEPVLRESLAAHERVLGPEDPATLTSVKNLALLLRAKGDLAAAEPLYHRALEASERVLGPEHPDTLRSVNNLALLLRAKGDLAAAEPLYRRALTVQERVLGLEHPDTLISINNLAGLLYDKGNSAGALPLFERAVQGLLQKLGPDHPNTKCGQENLARVREQLAKKGKS